MLLNHDEICELVAQGVIEGAELKHVNGTSLDITLGKMILVEDPVGGMTKCGKAVVPHCISYANRESPKMKMVDKFEEYGYALRPGEFALAGSAEIFHIPLNISCEYKLKSSMARIGLQHLNAGWCDPGWNNSCLTMELVNVNRFHSIHVKPGDRIGQIVFFRHHPVRAENSYAQTGRYNGDAHVHRIKI